MFDIPACAGMTKKGARYDKTFYVLKKCKTWVPVSSTGMTKGLDCFFSCVIPGPDPGIQVVRVKRVCKSILIIL